MGLHLPAYPQQRCLLPAVSEKTADSNYDLNQIRANCLRLIQRHCYDHRQESNGMIILPFHFEIDNFLFQAPQKL